MLGRISVPTLLALLLIGCSDDDGKTRIDFWNFGGTPHFYTWVDAQIAEYNESHPEVRVVKNQKSWNMIRELLFTNFSAGTGPDVVTVHANYAAEFGGAGYFLPLEQFAGFEEIRQDFVPNILETTSYQGRHYGLPFSALTFVLVCNKEMFDAAGLDPPRTWSELRSTAKQLTRDTDGDGRLDQWGMVLLGGDRGGFSYRLAPLIYKAGAAILSDDLDKAVFDSPEAVSAVQLLADMYQVDQSITPGFLAYTLSEINDLFTSNKVAMGIEGPWFRSMVDDKSPGKEYYTVPVPVPDDRIDLYDTSPTLQDLVMFSVSGQSENPEEAWEFIRALRTVEQDLHWLEVPMGGLPTTNAAWADPEADEKVDAFAVYRHELQYARPWPSHPKIISIVRNVIAPYGQQAIVGDLSPGEAMRLAVAEADALLGE